MYYTYVAGPVGPFLLAGTSKALHFTGFTTGRQRRDPQPGWQENRAALSFAVSEFEAYFAGEAVEFNSPLEPVGTPFQLAVWAALRAIPRGETCSYGDIALRLGKPGAARAVGAANGANHLPIVIPCHRVIGADRTLTGFGGGLETKATLLALEGVAVDGAARQITLL